VSDGLVFYEKSHRYKLDGKWVPGVTTLIKGGLPNDALKYWSAKCVAEYVAEHEATVEQLYRMGRGPMVQALKEVPWQKRDDAAVRGTDVHALAERLVSGEKVGVPEHLSGYVDACVAFLDEWQPAPLVVERPLAHRAHWWAGKPDLFASLPDGRVILWDYKTAASGIWPETAFQLAAYAHAEFYVDEDGEEQPVPPVDLCAAVWLRPDGYDVIPLKADDDTYREFRHIAFVSAAAKRAKGDKSTPGYVGQPLTPPALEKSA
jgi:hypothetical protein